MVVARCLHATGLVLCWGLLSAACLAQTAVQTGGQGWATLSGEQPLVIGHRGASGYLPEHTLEAYRLAVRQGADFIEPDLVATRDGVLIARHEPNISATTDVATRPEFASRKTRKTVDGVEEEGWFASDFSLAEIKTLRALQTMPERDPSHNGRYAVPTLDEVLALARQLSEHTGRRIGVYPETKHPRFHKALGLPLEDRLLAALAQAGLTQRSSAVIVQSFDPASLKHLRSRSAVRLVQLLAPGASNLNPQTGIDAASPPAPSSAPSSSSSRPPFALSAQALREIRTYADGIGPWKTDLLPPSTLLRDAHAADLFVHAYTFRNEARRVAPVFQGDPAAEYRAFYRWGVDGVFSDFPDTAVAARRSR